LGTLYEKTVSLLVVEFVFYDREIFLALEEFSARLPKRIDVVCV
jgi:hypothetical protein